MIHKTLYPINDNVKFLCKNEKEEDFFLDMLAVSEYYDLSILGFTLPISVTFINKDSYFGNMHVDRDNLSRLHSKIPYEWWHLWVHTNKIVPNNYENN